MHHRSAILDCRTRVNVQKVWNIEIPSMPSPRLSKTRATSPSRNNSRISPITWDRMSELCTSPRQVYKD